MVTGFTVWKPIGENKIPGGDVGMSKKKKKGAPKSHVAGRKFKAVIHAASKKTGQSEQAKCVGGTRTGNTSKKIGKRISSSVGHVKPIN